MKYSKKRRTRNRNTITTRSGKSIVINKTLSDRKKSAKAIRAAEKATYLASLPKNLWLRILYRLHPKHLIDYWFSKNGVIMALKLFGIAVVVGFFLTIGLFAYFRKDLPQLKNISGDNIGGSVTYYDSTGKTILWQDYSAVKRIPVQSNQISKYMKEATVAIEDKNFYHEGAFSIRGIIRAAINDALGRPLQGGSTITQQLVKLNEGWTNNRTITRKIKELILAVEVGDQYTKSEILTGYLNIAPYGSVDYGVQAAAEDYFHTTAANLTLPQAAMLAAIPQAPTYYSPYSDSKWNQAVTGNYFSASALLGRQHYILQQMVTQKYISQNQASAAEKVNILSEVYPEQGLYQNIKAPYFVLAAKQQLIHQFGNAVYNRGGLKVITTLNMAMQNHAQQLVASNYSSIQKLTNGRADEEATVTENVHNGWIVDLVGGVNFNNPVDGQINYAASVLIPPGSSFKPYDYATFINDNNNVGAGSVLYDQEGPLPGYPCTNHALPQNGGNCLMDYDFKQPGPITLRYAIGGSRNIPAVKTMLEAVPNDTSPGHVNSINKVISTASALMDNTTAQSLHQNTYNCYKQGTNMMTATYADTTQCYSSSAIGDGAFLYLDDHVNGLASLARLGNAIPRTFIVRITDSANKVIYQWRQPKGTQVVRPDAAYIVDSMLSDPNASYLPGSCSATNCTPLSSYGYKFQRYNGWDFAIKTGTTNNGYDGLMTSWSTKYATVSWVGNHTRNVNICTVQQCTMEYLTEPLTRGMMEFAHQGLKPVNWVQPSDIKVLPAFSFHPSGFYYGWKYPSPSTDLYPSWYVGNAGKQTSSVKIDKVSGLLATSCTPSDAIIQQNNTNTSTWNVDIFVNHGQPNINTSSTTNSISGSKYDNVHNCNDKKPSIILSAPKICETSCTINTTVTQGTHLLTDPNYPQFPGTVTYALNGQTIYTYQIPVNSPATISVPFTYTPTSSGTGTITATITDSVLYQATTSAQMSYGTPLNMVSAKLNPITTTNNAPNYTFTWQGGIGPYSIYDSTNPNTPICSSSSFECNSSSVIIPTDTFYVQDSTGTKSSSIPIN